MKINKLGIIAAAFAIAGSPLAAHSEGFYLGGQYALTTIDASIGAAESAKWEPTNLILRGGLSATEYFQIEARLGFGLSDDDVNGVSLEVDQLVGLYGKFSMPTELSPYIILGYSDFEMDSHNKSDFSYGVGLDFRVSDNSAVNVEYMYYYDDSENNISAEVKTIGLGFTYKF